MQNKPLNKTVLSFFKNYPEISYQKGDKILHPNEYSDHIYLLIKGYIRTYKLLKSGQEITLNNYNANKQKIFIFGYTELIKNYYIESLTDVVLRRAPKQEFQKFLNNNFEIKALMDDLTRISLGELLTQIEWLSIPDSYSRVKMFIYSISMSIGKKFSGGILLDKSSVCPKITHQLVASMTGLSRETVTIQLNKLLQEGYLVRSNKTNIIIPNPERLIKDIY